MKLPTLSIELLGMRFYAHHGCIVEERQIGAHFNVDVSIETPEVACVESDRLEEALNYQAVYDAVTHEMQKPAHLLEHIAGRILRRIKTDFPQVGIIKVCVTKLNPPVGGPVAASRIVLTSE